ncbi:MAG TPA: integrase, partial [Massilibacterium sp.]|nr:integrase [Massilibacterium sp.]
MQEVIERKNDMQVLNWKNDLLDSSSYKKLRERIHQAEKLKQNPFYDFTDVEMIQWYLHRRQHLDRTHDKTERTIKEYARELSLFVHSHP